MGHKRQGDPNSFTGFKFVDATGTVTKLNVSIKVAGASSANGLSPLNFTPPNGNAPQCWSWAPGAGCKPETANDINQLTVSFDYQQLSPSGPVQCSVNGAQFGVPQAGNGGPTAWRAGYAVVTLGLDYSLTYALNIQASSVSS